MNKNIRGLSAEEVKKSRELHGTNALAKEKKSGFFKRFIENLSDPIIRILLVALSIQIVFTFRECNYIEVIGILAAIIISTGVSTVSEYRSERAFEELDRDGKDVTVPVLRGQGIERVGISEIVVGDILYISAGEKIHADGTVIEGKISVDQSALNGESVECHKFPSSDSGWELSSNSKVFRGSLITEGSATVRVGRVGASTYYGMVAKDVQIETRKSPLKLRLTKLANQISKIGYIVALIVGLSYIFNALVIDNGFNGEKILDSIRDFGYLSSVLVHTLTLVITVVVVAAPEGLPMMITVVLSANMNKMLSDNILVKKLVGIETAGSMNILFTDKTGTITEGRPRCEKIITAEQSYKTVAAARKNKELFWHLLINARYNTDVSEIGGETVGGNSTDRAIFSAFSGDITEVISVKEKIPFSSERKMSSVTLTDGRKYIKGAPEMILPNCRSRIGSGGQREPFDIKSVYDEYYSALSDGHRVVCMAMSEPGGELIFLALIVMKDKIRQGVRESVKAVSDAGIQVVMITGDSEETAKAIATECGIMNPRAGHIAIGSDELSKMTDAEIKSLLPKIRVVYRALPQDKLRLVALSQELNLVVGMTGDGINDAPSLKLADIGFAMGSGSDIAKSASDVVILDDSFLAISKAVLYGRTIFKSIRKFITFQLTMNLAASGVSLIGQFLGVDTPITIIQMLWVNIIMDTLGGLAFAGEPPMAYYMKEKPKHREEPLLSREMLNGIFFNGAYTLAMCILFLSSYVFKSFYPTSDKFYTAFYALFIFFGIFNCFSARSERLRILSNIGKNRLFVFIMLLISAIQIFMIYFGGAVFRCTPLSARELLFAIGIAITVIPFDIIRRVVYKLK